MVSKLTSGMSLTGNGLRDWLAQRISALVIAIYFFVVMLFFICYPDINYLTFKNFFSQLWMQIFTLIVLLSLFVHAWVGIWTVITDYIKPLFFRILLQILIILLLSIYFFWGVEILWRLA